MRPTPPDIHPPKPCPLPPSPPNQGQEDGGEILGNLKQVMAANWVDSKRERKRVRGDRVLRAAFPVVAGRPTEGVAAEGSWDLGFWGLPL